MSIYNNILVAVNISNEAETVLSKAQKIAALFESKITLVHIIEPVVVETNYDLSPTLDIELQQNLTERANDFLSQLTEKMQLNNSQSIVTVGKPKHEIHRLCEEGNVDLVVIGTHGRSGVSMLLGSTANAVLHGTACDVLAVKL